MLKRLQKFIKQKQLKRPEYQYLFDTPATQEWVCLDLEMTGLNPKTEHILSVGAIKIVQKDGVLSIDTGNALSLICRPPTLPSPESIIIHGLRPVDVENGISYDELLTQLLPFIGNRPIVGFCIDMDMAFLNAIIKPFLGTTISPELLDVTILEQRLRQRKAMSDIAVHRKHLNVLIDEYHIPRLPAHDALNDALMTAMVFCHVYQSAQQL